MQNKKPSHGKTSPHKGVSWCKQTKKWRATIGDGKRQFGLGRFASEDLAAEAYNAAAVVKFGEFAVLNKISGVS
jgi:hypothetical protein